MSTRVKGRRGARVAYSSPWSDWMWSDEHQDNYRYRLKAPDDSEYDFEWENDQPSETPWTSDDPALASAPESYSQSQNYTTSTTGTSRPDGGSRTAGSSDIDSVTASFAQASINPGSAINPGAVPNSSNPAQEASPYTSAPSNGSQAYASPTTGLQNHIKTRDPYTDREEFDPHYKVHQSWAFKWGRIFKVLWAEPKGAEGDGSTGQSGTESLTVRKGAGGKETWAKVRRFVIIKPMEGHCICLPILTYSGQGVNKRGVHADHHAIIYSGRKPMAFRGEKEKGLQMRSIKVTPDNPRHKLDDASRLNYAKTYTVEYDVKVWFIGKVSSDSEWQIRTDYNRVHPPLEIRGVRPPDTPDDTYEYAQGGSGSAYTSTSTYTSSYGTPAYPAASSSAGYSATPAYDTVLTFPGTYGPLTEGADGSASPRRYSTSSFPAPGYGNGTYGQDEGYMTGAYRPPERPRRRSRRRGDPEPEAEEARGDQFHDAYDIYDA